MKRTGDRKDRAEGTAGRGAARASSGPAGTLLADDELDKVAGGAIFDASGICGSDPERPWEVLDDKGEVVGRAASRFDAIGLAVSMGVNYNEVGWDDVLRMRGKQ